ncbi:MAG: 3-deoxy-D-manno-octulosonic acid transferase [Acidobacteriota bacterium]
MMRTLGWLGYQAACTAALGASAPFFAARRGWAHYRPTLRGRRALGLGRGDGRPRLWVHAVSVGEVGVAATLIRRLPESLPLVVTTVTPTGQAEARRLLGKRAEIAYLPFDLGPPVARFLERFNPRGLILVEGDYWPLVLSRMAPRGPIAVVNGRLSDRALSRQRPLGSVNGLFYSSVSAFGVQTAADRERLMALGVDPSKLRVTGNLKYDAPEPPRREDLEALITRVAAGRPILLAGSTMEGEERAVLQAADEVGGGDRALVVIAPRHPERWPAVAELLEQSPRGFARRSELDEGEPGGRVDLVLLDSLGELAGLYRLATAAFIGGTLVETGGHNPLEPARFAVPTAVGPSMSNFRLIAERFDDGGGWARVASGADLGAVWNRWLRDGQAAREVGERGREIVESNRGATARTLELLEPLLARPEWAGESAGRKIQ